MGGALAYHAAMAACVLLILACAAAGVRALNDSGWNGPTLLMIAFFPGLYPGGFLCLILYGYLSDYRSEQAKGILGPRFQFHISHLLLLVFLAAIVCAFVALGLRILML